MPNASRYVKYINAIMIQSPRLLSHLPSLLFAAVAFAVGMGVGAGIGPVTARNGQAAPPTVAVPEPALRTEVVRIAHPAEVLRVIDGDTFEVRVHLWPGLNITTRVRLRGIDTPELKARCMEERIKAEAARDALRAILEQGEVGIVRVTLDKFGGRVLADASTYATPDVAEKLLGAGHARRYGGARRETWCP